MSNGPSFLFEVERSSRERERERERESSRDRESPLYLSAFAVRRTIIVLVTRKKHVSCENLQIV